MYGVLCALLTDYAFDGCLRWPDAGVLVWTAGRRINSKFVWKVNSWTSYPLTYTNWYRGEPNNDGGNEDCLHLFTPNFHSESWNDVPCDLEMCFVCEFH